MTDNTSGLPKLPLQLNALQILGLREPEGVEWARLRSMQYAEMHRVSLMRVAAHGIAALILMRLYLGLVPHWLILAWLLLLAATKAYSVRIDMQLRDARSSVLSRPDYWRQAKGVALYSLVWALPLFAMPPGAYAEHHAAFALAAMMIAGTAAMMASAPIATVIFAGVVGGSATLSFLLRGEYLLSVGAATFSFMVIAAAILAARTYLSARIAEAGAAEKDEVVSLLLREFEENEADWLWQIDTNRCIRAVSPRFAYALGIGQKDIEGRKFVEVIAGERWNTKEVPRSLHDLAERLKRRESFSNLLVEVSINGNPRWWELSGTPMKDESGNFFGYRGVGSDVTDKRESDEKIAYLARYDTLTGLPNRLMLTEALGEAMRYSAQWKTRCAFLMIDLDRFKSVNDSLGHQIGDKLLALVSERLSALMNKNLQCGRLGGDEFAVVIRDSSDPTIVERVAHEIITRLSAPYVVDNHRLFIGASVGSAIGPRDGGTVETLMRNADLALYRSKDDGGGVHCKYVPALHADAEERRQLELSLRTAIENDEMSLAFQPVVDSNSEQVVSFEALLRWNNPDHGLVSPAKFIPLAEETRLIIPIGEWVLREACREAANWPDEIKVAVNVSGEQLLDRSFCDVVMSALRETGLPPHRLEIEVTESVFLRDGRMANATLQQILDLGCGIALDDFGTGYSSLGYLRTIRFSTIKVDRSFVEGASQNSPESLAIIRAVIAMAQSLDMATTAEGVETDLQVDMCRDLGCTKIQGYYFGRPMPAREARALVTRQRVAA